MQDVTGRSKRPRSNLNERIARYSVNKDGQEGLVCTIRFGIISQRLESYHCSIAAQTSAGTKHVHSRSTGIAFGSCHLAKIAKCRTGEIRHVNFGISASIPVIIICGQICV